MAHGDKDEAVSPATQALIDEEIKRLLKVDTHTHTHTLSLSLSLTHTHTHTHTLTHTLTHTHTHTHTQESRERAQNMLKQYSVEHKRLAEALLKYETLSLEEIRVVITGTPLERKM